MNPVFSVQINYQHKNRFPIFLLPVLHQGVSEVVCTPDYSDYSEYFVSPYGRVFHIPVALSLNAANDARSLPAIAIAIAKIDTFDVVLSAPVVHIAADL